MNDPHDWTKYTTAYLLDRADSLRRTLRHLGSEEAGPEWRRAEGRIGTVLQHIEDELDRRRNADP